MFITYQHNHTVITTNPNKINLESVCEMLLKSYWASSRSKETIIRSIENSLCYSILDGEKQIGFARIITDYAVLAYLCDVYIDESYRGQGLGKHLMKCVLAHPELQGIRKWLLVTNDAHGLYQQFDFKELEHPEKYMERINS